MRYVADLHVHSKYSRATAKNADLENYYLWAKKKGVNLVGTGDCTHPAWFAEIENKLVPAEEGLFSLKPELAAHMDGRVPPSCVEEVRFVLSAEISCIYKRGEKTRKNHNVILFPDLSSARRFNQDLEKIGNIRSDGRPILGLDARHLLEIALGASEDVLFIPAHVWTPWFSMLGSKSGFDGVKECFGELSEYIFAVETGLSSDPPMNWRVPELDRMTLVSNSDAHSPAKLMREANLVEGELSYPGLARALKMGVKGGFAGTIEFFPEEGKYHLDGHRKCGVVLEPEETRRLSGLCPRCGRPLTLGVAFRVHELAGRPAGEKPPGAAPYYSLVPLCEVLAEVLGKGPATKAVATAYEDALAAFGPERNILMDTPLEKLEGFRLPLLAEALGRMRKGDMNLAGGFDGEYGKVKIFADGERERLAGQAALFAGENLPRKETPGPGASRPETAAEPPRRQAGLWDAPAKKPLAAGKPGPLNPEQQRAVEEVSRPVLVCAGPGTGKTRTLVHRIARLLESGVSPEAVLAVTFTNKAGAQLKERLEKLCPGTGEKVFAGTFHALCLDLLARAAPEGEAPRVAGPEDQEYALSRAAARMKRRRGEPPKSLSAAARAVSRAKQVLAGPEDPRLPEIFGVADPAPLRELYRAYQEALAESGLLDFDDILFAAVRRMEEDPDFLASARRFSHVCVDEYQDINFAQYRLVSLLCPDGRGLFVIGDPDQAIYGFRGADCSLFHRFAQDHPAAAVVELSTNYRSAKNVLAAASRVIRPGERKPRLSAVREDGPKISLLAAPTPAAEAEAVVAAIEAAVGGTSLFSVDSGRGGYEDGGDWSFSDFAVLFRTRDQAGPVAEALARGGIPFQTADRKAVMAGPEAARLVSLLKVCTGCAADPDVLRAIEILPEGARAAKALLAACADNGRTVRRTFELARRGMEAGLPPDVSRALAEVDGALKRAAGDVAEAGSVEQMLSALVRRFPMAPLGQAPAVEGGEAPLQRLRRLARDFGADARSFAAFAATATDADVFDPRADRVTLSTVHAAKGLEFEGVFVLGCEDGLFPLRLPGRKTDEDEERRLFYVAVTRAARRLWLFRAKRRTIRGRTVQNPESPFLSAVSKKLLDVREASRPGKRTGPVQKRLFAE
ncbi:MAG: UvrD-helicase domain-containing protein [Deltaproteobacteria bacterium]|nr:UvrD-helicase domain-containing protein [Deltaproteobacteria bacterium]